MSHFTVLVVGDNQDEQLAPFCEQTEDPQYLEFNDRTEEAKEEYETGTTQEFYCASNSSWGKELNKDDFDVISVLKIGETHRINLSTLKGFGCYLKLGSNYRGYHHKPTDTDHWFKVVNIDDATQVTDNVAYRGEVVVKKIEPPKDVPLKDKYSTFEEFVSEYYGYEWNETEGGYGYHTNPRAKWDWYQLGGRWTGFFKMKQGIDGEVGEPGIMTDNAETGYADSARKGNIDFDGMRQEAMTKAGENYDKIVDFFDGTIPKLEYHWPRDFFDGGQFENKTQDEKRTIYHDQEALKTLAAMEKSKGTDLTGFYFSLEDYQCTRQEYMERADYASGVTFAVLMNGEWYERGNMGWWGCVSHEKSDWDKEFHKLLDSIDDDEIISVYDCHI